MLVAEDIERQDVRIVLKETEPLGATVTVLGTCTEVVAKVHQKNCINPIWGGSVLLCTFYAYCFSIFIFSFAFFSRLYYLFRKMHLGEQC